MSHINGTVSPGFERVADAFAATAGGSGGSALHVRHHGKTVVDLWQGQADDDGRAWAHDTPTVVFSCTKGLLSLLIVRLVQEGRLDLDVPVATYWPEFAAAGKEAITVRQLLSHRAGLAALRADVDLPTALDWSQITSVIAEAAPLWEPDTAYGYHALTFGWLAGELVRRIAGRPVGEVFHTEIAGPLAADAWIGVPPSEQPRIARLMAGASASTPPPMTGDRAIDQEEGRWMERAMTLGDAFPAQMVVRGQGFDDPLVQQAEVPGAGGVASAAALASIWSSAIVETDGIAPLDERVINDMTRVQSEGEPVWWLPGPYPRWGTGFMLPSRRREFLTARSFGHDGAGGQVAFADRTYQIGFGYVTNLLELHSDDRGDSIVRALGAALGSVDA